MSARNRYVQGIGRYRTARDYPSELGILRHSRNIYADWTKVADYICPARTEYTGLDTPDKSVFYKKTRGYRTVHETPQSKRFVDNVRKSFSPMAVISRYVGGRSFGRVRDGSRPDRYCSYAIAALGVNHGQEGKK